MNSKVFAHITKSDIICRIGFLSSGTTNIQNKAKLLIERNSINIVC